MGPAGSGHEEWGQYHIALRAEQQNHTGNGRATCCFLQDIGTYFRPGSNHRHSMERAGRPPACLPIQLFNLQPVNPAILLGKLSNILDIAWLFIARNT